MKRGFTLVELLCVIIIISIVTMITVPIINKQIIASRDALYRSQINDIEAAGKKFATEKNDLLDINHINDTYISLYAIQQLGYLEKGNIIDPMTKKKMQGCILISYDNDTNGYTYEYNESSCSEYAKDNDAYIIYNYNASTNELEKDETKKQVSAVEYIINEYTNKVVDGVSINRIKVEGQTDSGLYDIESEYVFRGTSVDNYVKFNGEDFRILSIDKETKSLKLISVNGSAALFGDNVIFNKTTYYTSIDTKYPKINLNKNWDTGIVSDSNKSRSIIRQEVNSTKNDESILNFGLISLYDYVNASANDSCYDNFKSDGCASNNYLKDMFNGNSVWTLTRLNETDTMWYVDSNGIVNYKNINEGATYHKYVVLTLDSSVYISNSDTATGSTTSPFELK